MRTIKDTRPDYVPRTLRPMDDRPDARRKRIDDRKERFEQLNKLATACGDGWLVSVPGDVEVRMECLPSSDLPARLQALDYRLRDEGRGQRILAITPGSTMPVVHQQF
jgi:hypothetical protein